MLLDLHMHEQTFSSDSYLSLETIVQIAKDRGLDGICITDHDSVDLRQQGAEYSRQVSFPIIVGVEYYSLEGDIVAFGLDQVPDQRMGAQAFINLVKSQGGACISAHPFRNNNRGLGEQLSVITGLDGIEAFNGSTSPQANQKALDYCRRLGIQPIGSSDCHVPEQVGHFATWLPDWVTTEQELILSLQKGLCYPVAFTEHSGYTPLLHQQGFSSAS